MFVFVPMELFERKPIFGVALGIAGILLGIGASAYSIQQYRTASQPAAEISLRNASAHLGRWVRVKDEGELLCSTQVVRFRPWDHAILFGDVDSTHYLFVLRDKTGAAAVSFAGKTSCENAKKHGVVGLLDPPNPDSETAQLQAQWQMLGQGPLYSVCTDCTAQQAVFFLVVFVPMTGAALWLTRRYWRKKMALDRSKGMTVSA
jgi:hypothetical protein